MTSVTDGAVTVRRIPEGRGRAERCSGIGRRGLTGVRPGSDQCSLG
ncbi:hypothetical protein [Nocardiopsis deserti]|nr:hypothetical protein [Nocardiopsis deserti]